MKTDPQDRTVEKKVVKLEVSTVPPLPGTSNILHLKAGNSNFYAVLGSNNEDVFVNSNLDEDDQGISSNSAYVLFESLISFFKFAED